MTPREPELPEGTDHIINGALETGTGAGASSGSSGPAGGRGASRADRGFIGSGDMGSDDGTGGTVAKGSNGRSAVSKALNDGTAALKRQAGDRVRQFADEGKTRVSDALDEAARAVEEAASMVDERLGEQYGGYARRAAERVSGLATNLREKEVDELYEDARDFVRTSPVLTVGVAAAVGFALVRLIRAGMPEEQEEQPSTGKGSRGRKKGA